MYVFISILYTRLGARIQDPEIQSHAFPKEVARRPSGGLFDLGGLNI